MLKRDLGPVTVMGFARYRAKEGVDPADLIAAARVWQRDFLAHQPGIAMHCFLGNQTGEYADAILATDPASFMAMAEAHAAAPSSGAFMEFLDRDSIRLTQNMLLGGPQHVPQGFACIEFGSFSPKETDVSDEAIQMAAERIRQDYLSRLDESKAHFMARIDDTTYSEIAFVETEGAAREICNGYLKEPACLPLLGMFDPASVDLDFWHVLA